MANKKNFYFKKNDSGFTLIELLLSAVLLLILIGPLLAFLRAGQINRSVTVKTTDLEQNARAAMITMGRDITNAGFNFAPQFSLGSVTLVNALQGGNNILTPVIPGNNLNPVNTSNSSGSVVTNSTDQITLVYVDQTFNNGLPVTGNYNLVGPGAQFTLTSGMLTGLFPGDLIFLNRGTVFSIATVTSIAGNVITINTGDFSGLNKFGAMDPLSSLALPIAGLPVQPPILLYKFFFITFFVDQDGNLIRRELLAPPHTTIGGPNNVADARTYNCAATCYYDNIIATGIEDLQFTYSVNGAQPAVTPIDDPGAGGAATNLGAAPLYRLNDIREVNVSLKVRAADRDTVVRDKNSPGAKNGYYYRFSLDGTFGVRNLYQTNYVPDLN
jgi:prepilin-type N-terminal cleavage/methylation domain-containing protein